MTVLLFVALRPGETRRACSGPNFNSLKWQHQLCKNPNHKPGILTLFVDHLCVTDNLVCAVPPSHSNGPRAPSSVINPLLNAVPASRSNGAGAPSPVIRPLLLLRAIPNPMGPTFEGSCYPGSPSLDEWMTNLSSDPHPSASAGSTGFNIQDCSDILTHLRMPVNNPVEDYQNDDPEQVLKRTRPSGRSNEHEDSQSLVDWKSKVADESSEKSIIWKLKEVNDPSSCRSLRLPDSLVSTRVSRLMYANSGNVIMSLYANAVHKLWKWPKNYCNPTGEARTNTVPQLWQPCSEISVTNYISLINPEDAVPCFALSKNDAYVISTSGGGISLFNAITFQKMATFMPPPPAATFLAFHPQDNNIIAIGMDDSSILIYYVRLDKVQAKLDAHQKRITGLTDGGVCVIEPLESEGEWGTLPPQEDNACSSTGHADSSDQFQREARALCKHLGWWCSEGCLGDAAYYCICNDGLSDAIYQKNIDYACGAGADCTPIMQNGPCFQPNTVENHCNFAVNSYYQRYAQVQGSCSFSNTVTVVQDPPPAISECLYSSSPRAVDRPIIHFSLSIKLTLGTGLVVTVTVTVIGVLKLFQMYRRSARVNEGENHQEAANHINGPGEIEINTVGHASIMLDSEV
ncbi:unnamed protein product [Fraxinus pennsylvanica]|uniref:X8 domain-containing protein n=1 Tax=Fraxinus pennsylvanica TaxID=56036 RepID=A0AAD2EAR6_9LAMI|nr:unnamed protein product [Fraxinus pennsylvanica]